MSFGNVMSSYQSSMHEFGEQRTNTALRCQHLGTNTIANAIELDQWNGNTFWMDSYGKEMGNLIVAFEIKHPGEKATPGWFKTTGHIVWDVKMDFTWKA